MCSVPTYLLDTTIYPSNTILFNNYPVTIELIENSLDADG